MSEKTAEPPPLTFRWVRTGLESRGLAFWLLIVLLGFAAFFYLFQVVYPQEQRIAPTPHHIVALNPADPAARELLNKVQDVDFLVLPPPSEAISTVNLDDHSPVFHPTFEGHKLQLEDLPHKTFTVPPARLLKMDEPVLPPLDLSELKSSPLPSPSRSVAVPPRLSVRFSGPLALRAITALPDFSSINLSDPAGCRFQIGVNADGRVDVALPVASSEEAEMTKKLGGMLQNVRFAPAEDSSTGPIWGIASFELKQASSR